MVQYPNNQMKCMNSFLRTTRNHISFNLFCQPPRFHSKCNAMSTHRHLSVRHAYAGNFFAFKEMLQFHKTLFFSPTEHTTYLNYFQSQLQIFRAVNCFILYIFCFGFFFFSATHVIFSYTRRTFVSRFNKLLACL